MRRNTARSWLTMMTGRTLASRPWVSPAIGVAVFVAVVFFATNFQLQIRALVSELFQSRGSSTYEGLSRSEIETRLTHAEEELNRIRYQSILYGLVVDENTQLRETASIESITTVVPARVLARPPRTHYDTLLVSAGSVTGISVNDRVVWNGVFLGEVVSLAASVATVELLSTPQSEHDVVLGEPKAVAIARGLGGGASEVQVPQNVTVNTGDLVRAATDETLLFGVVVSVSGSPTEATKTVHVAAPVSMSEIDFVSIIPQEQI